MAVTTLDRRVVVSDADTLTNWSGADTLEPVVKAEGTNAVCTDYGITTGTIFYTPATPLNLDTDILYVQSYTNALQNGWKETTLSDSSHMLYMNDGTNEIALCEAGSDRDVFKHSKSQVQYQSFLIDLDYLATKNTNGEVLAIAGSVASFVKTSVDDVGSRFVTLSKALGGGVNCFVDIIRIDEIDASGDATTSTSGIFIYGGGVGTEGTFDEIVLDDESVAADKGFGIIREYTAGVYGCQGILKFGTTNTQGNAYFSDTNFSLSFENRDLNDDKFAIYVFGNSTNTNYFEITNGTITSAGPGVTVNISSNNINTLNIDNVSFSNLLNTVTFPTDSASFTHDVNGCTFLNCGQVVPGTVNFTNNLIDLSNTSASGALLIDSASNVSNWSDLDFVSPGTGYAIVITQTGSYTFTNYTYTGYGNTGTANAVIYNNSGGAVTITVSGGDTPTYNNATVSESTTIVTSISINIEVQDSDQNPVSDAYVYITDGLVEVENSLSDVNGEVVSSYSGSQPTGTLRIRKYGYEAYSATLNLTSNVSINATLVTDPLQVTSPLDFSSEWEIDYTGKTIKNLDSGIGNNLPINSGSTTYINNISDWFRWIANDASSGDTIQYQYPINSITPSQYELINGWNFGDNENDYKYLKLGSISTSGNTKLFSNLYSIGSQTTGTRLYIIQNNEEVVPWWVTGDIDILVKIKDNNTFIQSIDNNNNAINGAVWVYCREFGDNFDHNFIDLSAGGRNPISINSAPDLNNLSGEIYLSVTSSTGFIVDNFVKGSTSGAVGKIEKISTNDIYLNGVRGGTFVTSETIAEYSDRETTNPTGQSTTNDGTTPFFPIMSNFDNISITFGNVTKDLNNGAGLKPYEVVVDCSGETLSNVYEYLKYVVRYDSSGATYTIDGDAGQEYRNASGSTWTDVKVAPFGTFAGGKFFGARGVFIENMAGADIQNYQLIDSNGITQRPPELYLLTLTGLIPGSEVRLFTGGTSEIAGVENSTDTFSYNYTYTSDESIDIVILALGYVYIRLYNFTLTNQNATLPIQQQRDRWYNNP